MTEEAASLPCLCNEIEDVEKVLSCLYVSATLAPKVSSFFAEPLHCSDATARKGTRKGKTPIAEWKKRHLSLSLFSLVLFLFSISFSFSAPLSYWELSNFWLFYVFLFFSFFFCFIKWGMMGEFIGHLFYFFHFLDSFTKSIKRGRRGGEAESTFFKK